MDQSNLENFFLAQNSTRNVSLILGAPLPIRKPVSSSKNVADISLLQFVPDAYSVSLTDVEIGQGYLKHDFKIIPIAAVPETWMLGAVLFLILGAFIVKRRLIQRLLNWAQNGGSIASAPVPRQSLGAPHRTPAIARIKRQSAEILRWVVCLGLAILIVDLQVRKHKINTELEAFHSFYVKGNWKGAVDAMDQIIRLRKETYCNVLFRNFCSTFARIPLERYVANLQEAILAASDAQPTPEQADWLKASSNLKVESTNPISKETADMSVRLQYETLVRMISYHLLATTSKPSSEAKLALEYALAARDVATEPPLSVHAASNLAVVRYHRTAELLAAHSLRAAKQLFAEIDRRAISDRNYALLDACLTEQEFDRSLALGNPREAVAAVIACHDRSVGPLSADELIRRRLQYDIALGSEQEILKKTIYQTDLDQDRGGRFTAAADILRFLKKMSPEDVNLPEDAQMRLFFLAGFELQQGGWYDLAATAFQDAYELAPSKEKKTARAYLVDALVICAKNHLRHDRVDIAVKNARQANDLAPRFPEVIAIFRAALLTRARFYRQTGDPVKADVDLDTLASEGKLAPANAERWGISDQAHRISNLQAQTQMTWLELPDIRGEVPIDSNGDGRVDHLLFYDGSKALCAIAPVSSSQGFLQLVTVLDEKKRPNRQIMDRNGDGWFDSVLFPQVNGERYLYDQDGNGTLDLEATTRNGKILDQVPRWCTKTILSVSAIIPPGLDQNQFLESGSGDGYVRITFNGGKEWHRSDVQNDVTRPEWSFSDLSFTITSPGNLRIQLWDKDLMNNGQLIEDYSLRTDFRSYASESFPSKSKLLTITMKSVMPVFPKGFIVPDFVSIPNLELPSLNAFEGENLGGETRAHLAYEYPLFRSALEREAKASKLLGKGVQSERWFARQPLTLTDPGGFDAEETDLENSAAPVGMASMLVGALCGGILLIGGIQNFKFLTKNNGTAIGNCSEIAIIIGGLFGVLGVLAVFGRACYLAADPIETLVWAPLIAYLVATFWFCLILAFKAYFGIFMMAFSVASIFYELQQHGSLEILGLFKIVTDWVLGSSPSLVQTFMTLLLSTWCMLIGLFGLSSCASNGPMSVSDFFDAVA